MTDGVAFVRVLTLQRQLEALAYLGIDVDAVRARVGELPSGLDALVPARLHLLAIMYTAFRQIDPTMDTGADFSAEYQAALEMQQK